MILSLVIFVAPKQIKKKEKVTNLMTLDNIVEDANVTLQHLDALEVVIYTTEGVQDDDIDSLQNSTRLGHISKLHEIKLFLKL